MSPFILCGVMIWILTGKWILEGQRPKADGSNEYAIILGAKVNGKTPSCSLQYRIDSGLAYAMKYPHVKLILSGGQGPDEEITEAEAMKRYLLESGIEEERLLLEPESTSTYENIHFSLELIPESIKGVTIITSDYHLARARKITENLDFQTDAIVAKTPQVVEKKLKTRERIALLKMMIYRR